MDSASVSMNTARAAMDTVGESMDAMGGGDAWKRESKKEKDKPWVRASAAVRRSPSC